MRRRSTLAAACAAVVAFATAGCGGSSGGAGAGGAQGGAAGIAPADTVAFVAVDTDLGSAQWHALDGLFQKLPQHDALLAQLRQSFEQHSKLSWANDVKPALGPELDVAVLPVASGGKPQVVLLAQPADASKLAALLAKVPGTTKPTSKQVGDWTAISESPQALAAVSSASQHLADSSVYQEAVGKLSGDALVRAYANGAEARQLVSGLGGSLPAGHGQLVWAAADVVAASGGLAVDGYTRSEGATGTQQPYASQLVGEIPSGALAVADFQAAQDAGAQASSPSSPLGDALRSLGKTLHGETAVYASAGGPIPAVTLVTRSSDTQGVLDALHGVLSSVGSAAASAKVGSLDLGSLLGGLKLSHAVVDGNLVVSTSQEQVAAFGHAAQTLADDGGFQEAQSAAGMPAKTTGFVYVNLKEALPAVQGLATLAGASLPGGDLSALRSLTAYGSGSSGGIASFRVFLAVQ